MRDPAELKIGDGYGRPVNRPSPDAAVIRAFEQEFSVVLPEDYLSLLEAFNGGSPEVGVIEAIGDSIEDIFPLVDGQERSFDLFYFARIFADRLPRKVIPFAEDSSGNPFLLDLSRHPARVGILFCDEGNRLEWFSPSFSDFLDMLEPEPEEED